MLGVRTGQKALRAVRGSSFKLWESKEKLTSPNTPPAVHKTQGLRNYRADPPHPHWRKEAGEGERGKLSPREATPSHPANRPLVLSEDFLRPDQRRALGPRREKARHARGEGAKPLAARPEHGECSPPTHSDSCLQRPALPAPGLN